MTPEAYARRRIRTPVLAVTAAAWAAILVVHDLPAHHHHASNPTPAALLMPAAMMMPLLIPALRHGYDRSLPRRRWRAMTLLTVAYAAVWSAGWIVLRAAALPLAAGLLIAFVWQLTPLKQRCLNRRHARPPLPAFGAPADLGALRFGATHGLWCVGSCWALMLPAGGLPAMIVAAFWIWAETFEPPARPAWRFRLPRAAARTLLATARRPRGTAPGPRRWTLAGD